MTRFWTNNHHYISIEFFGLNLMPLRLQNIPSNEECRENAVLFTSHYNMYFMKNEAMNVTNLGIAGCLLFPNETKHTKYPAKEKNEAKKANRKKRRHREKAKRKSQDCCITSKLENYIEIYFLRKSDLQKLIFCSRI